MVQTSLPNCSLLLGIVPEEIEKHQSNFHNSCKIQRLLSRTNLAPVEYLYPTELHHASLQMQSLDCSESSCNRNYKLRLTSYLQLWMNWWKKTRLSQNLFCMMCSEKECLLSQIADTYEEKPLGHRRIIKPNVFTSQWHLLAQPCYAFPGVLFRLPDAFCIHCTMSFSNRWNCLVSEVFKQLLRIVLVKCHHPGKDCKPSFCSNLHKALDLVMGK